MAENKNKSVFKKNIILIVLILLIGVVPLLNLVVQMTREKK